MSTDYKVGYSPAAKDDLRGISHYLVHVLAAPIAAKSVTTRIRQCIRSLSTMPNRYALVDWEPWNSMGIRKVVVGNYIVFYSIENKEKVVTVTRILYGGRDIENIIQDSSESE